MAAARYSPRQLQAFLAVAERRSFAAASSVMALSASAVSQLVNELEAQLGFRVFDRTTRSVNLSQAGSDFLPSAERIVCEMHLAESRAAQIRARAVGVIRVAAPLVLACSILPFAIADFSRRYPGVVIRILDCTVDRLVGLVSSGEVEMAMGPDVAFGREVACIPLYDTPSVLWCAPTHPLAGRRRLRWGDLRGVRMVSAGTAHERSFHRSHLDRASVDPVSVEVVESITTAMGIAATGQSVMLAPAHVAPLAVKFDLVKRRVVGPEIMRRVCLYEAALREGGSTTEAFKGFLSEWLASRLTELS